jgi:alpha-tubulin suppressor-like RCC1 family protein
LENVTAISCGHDHMAALNGHNQMVCWGGSGHGQCVAPIGVEDIIAVHCGDEVTAALTQEGKLVCWGNNEYGLCNVPEDLNMFMCGNILM